MALITQQATAALTEREIVRQALVNALASIRGSQTIAARYIYGEPGRWRTLAEMQARVNEWGTDAAALFAASGKLAEAVYLGTGEVPQILPPGIEFTINADGSVTLSGVVLPEVEV
jgi:hypothetical protein